MHLQKSNWKYTALAFTLPMAGLLMLRLICTLAFDGEYSMLYSDMYHQYYPFFVAFRKALRSGDSLLYSWSVGMGMDYLGLISYYLASPLNLITALLPEGWMLGYFSFLMPLKLSLAGLFFAIFLKKVFGKEDFSLPLFSCFYALCAWALGYQWNIMWLDTFALLPLVMLGMYSLLKDRKFMLYTLMLFLSIYTNYYIGFFICIFVFFSFFCYEICFWAGCKRFFSDLLCIALFSALAIGLTAILSIPTLAALQTTQSSVNTFPEGFKLNIAKENTWKGLLDAMRQVAGNMNGGIELTFKEGLPNLFCGMVANMMGLLFFTAKEIKLRDKLCCAFMLLFFNVSFVIRQLDYIWHGFHFTNMIPYRFSFLYSFVMLYMAYRAWLHRHSFRPWQILLAGALAIGLMFCSDEIKPFFELVGGKAMILPWSGRENVASNLEAISAGSSYFLYNLMFIAAYTIALLFGNHEWKPASEEKEEIIAVNERNLNRKHIGTIILWGIMGVELVMILINFGIWFPGTNVSNYPKGTEDAQAVIQHMHNREADTLFYRAETAHSQTLNDGALNGYNGVSTFTSSANVKVTEFMRTLGYGAKNTYNRYCFEESSPVANLFLNLKYMIERDGKEKDNPYFDSVYNSGNVYLLENNAYLPLGFLTNAQMLNLNFGDDINRFVFQNQLMRAAAGTTEDCWNILSGYCLTIIGDDLTLNSQNQTGYCSFETDSNPGTVKYRYVSDQEGLFCFHVEQTKRNNITVYVNNSETALYAESYSLPQMLSVCRVYPGDVVEIRFRCSSAQAGSINVSAAVLNEEVFRNCYDTLATSQLELTTFENTYVEGTIQCDRNGILYTSIPQDGNWKASVDGKPAQIVLIGEVMVGLNLSEGYHTVTFTYENRAFTLGWKISLACLVILTGCYAVFYQPRLFMKRKKGKYEK